LPVDALGPVWQHGAAVNESENQFCLTRAAPVQARAKNQIYQLDELVYDLYGLTAAERALVAKSARK
jgi:hypothetical protein